jgi:phosphoglycerate kinase
MKTINDFEVAKAEVIICAHLGRPAGKPDPKYSLAPVAARLSELLGRAFGYISTGGGASLEFIRGKVLPGLAVLDEQ